MQQETRKEYEVGHLEGQMKGLGDLEAHLQGQDAFREGCFEKGRLVTTVLQPLTSSEQVLIQIYHIGTRNAWSSLVFLDIAPWHMVTQRLYISHVYVPISHIEAWQKLGHCNCIFNLGVLILLAINVQSNYTICPRSFIYYSKM